MENKTFNEIKVRKPSGFWYPLVGTVVKLLGKFRFNLKADISQIKNIKQPFVLIANHSSVADIAFTAGSFLPIRLNIVASKDLFTWKVFKPFIERMGCIPKSQCAIDVVSLKTMKAAIEQGRNVCIYPEGRTSLDGKELHYVPDSIGKFMKMLDAPVVISYTLGSYLTKPRYFHGFRRGQVKLEARPVLTQEQVREMKAKEIADVIRESLRFNDNIYQQTNHIRFKTDHPAKGMEYILYKCPKCGAEYQMRTTDRQIICDACGNTVTYTEYGDLIPSEGSKAFDRIDLWYDYEKECIDKELDGGNFYIEKPVTMSVEENRDFRLAGEGVLYIDDDYIGYRGTKDGEEFSCKTPLKTLHTVITKNEEGIDLSYPDGMFRFLFTEHKYSSKYGLIVEQNYRKKFIKE